MIPRTDFSPQVTGLDGGFSKGSGVSAMDDHNADSTESLNQITSGKPPRNLSVMRHCTSSAFLAELVRKLSRNLICSLISSSSLSSSFFRIGLQISLLYICSFPHSSTIETVHLIDSVW